jgi:hypothetical protein
MANDESLTEPGSTGSKRASAFVMYCDLADDNQFIGVIQPIDRTRAVTFHGWIEFMSAIEGFRGQSGPAR